jgi:hypothetical protein
VMVRLMLLDGYDGESDIDIDALSEK